MIFHSISGIYPFLLCFYFCPFVFCYVFSSNFPFFLCVIDKTQSKLKYKRLICSGCFYTFFCFVFVLFCFITLSLGVFRHIVEKIWLVLKFHFFLRTYWHFHFIELSQRHCSQSNEQTIMLVYFSVFFFCFFFFHHFKRHWLSLQVPEMQKSTHLVTVQIDVWLMGW